MLRCTSDPSETSDASHPQRGIDADMSSPDDIASPPPTGTAGRLRPRRGLPGSRAAVGGLLVTVAVLGTWYLNTDRGGGPTQAHVVAADDLAAGHRLTEADLQIVAVDLPPDHRGRTFRSVDHLVGAVTLGPIGAGEFVQEGAVGVIDEEPGAQFSFSVEREWALAGSITVGDRIDLYATDRDGHATRVLTNVTVQAVSNPGEGGIGDSGRQTITVGGTDPDDIAGIIGSTRTATLTVVRVTDGRSADTPVAVESPSVPTEGDERALDETTEGDES